VVAPSSKVAKDEEKKRLVLRVKNGWREDVGMGKVKLDRKENERGV
jgi:hypothetical protein